MATSGIPQPATLAMRPLVAGMDTNSPSLLMPPGSFRDVCGYDVIPRGLRRIDGLKVAVNEAVPFWPGSQEVASDIVTHWGNSDAQFTVVITDKAMYKVEFVNATSKYSPVFWQKVMTKSGYTAGTGVIAVATDNPVTLAIAAGDYVVSADNMKVRAEILSVNTTTITLVGATKFSGMTSNTFYILREFKAKKPYYVDWTVYARSTTANMILVDGSVGGIYEYNGGYLKPFTLHDENDAASYVSARTVMYFGGRLYFGCVGKGGLTYRQRIIWTEVLDLQEIPAVAYQDLDETPGQIVKMLGMGPLAFVYFNDAVYYGRQTNLAGLPYAFTKMDTGGIGLVSMRAACVFFEGQLFIGPDGIYYISSSQGFQSIGAPVLKDSIQLCQGKLENTLVRMDVMRNRVLFGFSTSGQDSLDKIFFYNYLTKAWSYSARPAVTAVSVVNLADEIELDDLGSMTYAALQAIGTQYNQFGGYFEARAFMTVNAAGILHQLEEDRSADAVTSIVTVPITARIETGDIDLDMPDTDKTATELRLKVAQGKVKRTAPVVFTVHGSLDKGESWKLLGTLAVPTTKSEGAVGFRLTGSHFRLRLESISTVEPYEIVEMTVRAVARGMEANRGGTSSNP